MSIERKIIIDKECKTELLRELKLLNIFAGTVYPELSSMSEHLKNEYLNGEYPKIKNKILNNSNNITPAKKVVESEEEEIISNFRSYYSKHWVLTELRDIFLNNFENYNIEESQIEEFILLYAKNESEGIKFLNNHLKSKGIPVLIRKTIKNKFIHKMNIYNIMQHLPKILLEKKYVVIVEENYDWKEYFSNPNNIKVPVYNKEDWAVSKYKVKNVNIDNLELYGTDCEAKLNYNKITSFEVSEYDYREVFLICDFKDEKLFEEKIINK